MVQRSATGSPSLRRTGENWAGSFTAMASPCEVLMDVDDGRDARCILSIVADEARRIESKFSRYLPGNLVHTINSSAGETVEVDEETRRLLDFAQELHQISEGRFDITSGVLRRAWTFDGSDRLPSAAAVEAARAHVGWERVEWDGQRLRLEPGMEIDLGGIGKEYAVDHAARLVAAQFPVSCLINFGGDLMVNGSRPGGTAWRVGTEAIAGSRPGATRLIHLHAGGMATSGDSRRFLLKDGVRYSHILDPTTGWPIREAPPSITVAAGTCVQAGMLATLAMLQGGDAEPFLRDQEVQYWIDP